MMKVLSAAAAIAALTVAPAAFAQSTGSAATSSTPPASGEATETPAGAHAGSHAGMSGASSAAQAGADASVTTGMTVKDKSGASIGQVADVKREGGKTMATIKMGADTFAVDAANLAVDGGAATINATQAEIQQMLKK
ncbi:MAG: hypothetical protein ACOY9C_06230 [Pseudomonadota bacterium]